MYKREQDVSESFSIAEDVITLEDLDSLSWVPVDEGLLLEGQEDTMDAAMKFNPQQPSEFIPTTPLGPPDRKTFAGDIKFEVEICGAHTNKSKYLYSHRLNRIYVDMGYSFSVQFKWDVSLQPYPDMYVRATTVFCEQAQAEKPVSRCIQHYHDIKNVGAEASEAMRMNVLHSARGLGTQDVFYCGVGNSPDYWLSVLVRLAQPTTHAYQFACKNSCSSGINRRTIAIIFTLEDFRWIARKFEGFRLWKKRGDLPPGDVTAWGQRSDVNFGPFLYNYTEFVRHFDSVFEDTFADWPVAV